MEPAVPQAVAPFNLADAIDHGVGEARWQGLRTRIGNADAEGDVQRVGAVMELWARMTSGSAHCTGKPRGSGWDSGRTKLPNPRAPPTLSDADRGGGWERVRRHHRAGGSLEAAVQSER